METLPHTPHFYTHKCRDITEDLVGAEITVSGWIHRVRNHGSLLFLDIRDCTEILQLVTNEPSLIEILDHLSLESVIKASGTLVFRDNENINNNIRTGTIELKIKTVVVLSRSKDLPFSVNQPMHVKDELSFAYRFLALRQEENKKNIMSRLNIFKDTREFMWNRGFSEFQTPLLTATSPEGARDFVVHSRNHPGLFYALPQSPQLFKQMLMISTFENYFQIAPCFRDEELRASRGLEFYQLDLEMCFATKEQIMRIIWDYAQSIFSKYLPHKKIDKEIKILSYDYVMENYSSDKPDLRNPLKVMDITKLFSNTEFEIFRKGIQLGKKVKCICLPIMENNNRKPTFFFKDILEWAKTQFNRNIAYSYKQDGEWKGPVAKFIPEELNNIADSGVFFVCDFEDAMRDFLSKLRDKLGAEYIDHNTCSMFFVSDFPMYEYDRTTGKWDFMHNPFSKPVGSLEELNSLDISQIKSNQYDLVFNGNELGSGAERNDSWESLVSSFKKIGKDEEYVRKTFPSFEKAFQYGVPPHAGMALGMERIVTLCLEIPDNTIRYIVPFPLTQTGEDLLMGAPSFLSPNQIKEMKQLGFVIPNTKK